MSVCDWLSLSVSLEKSFIISKYCLLIWELRNLKEINIRNKVEVQSISHILGHVIGHNTPMCWCV